MASISLSSIAAKAKTYPSKVSDFGKILCKLAESVKAYVDSGTATLTNKTLTSPVVNTGISGTAIKDEDNMASDSATCIPTQQSVKAYVDTTVKGRAVAKGVNFAALAADYAILATDGYEVFIVNDAITITLPAVAANVGRRLLFVQNAAAVLTIAQNTDNANIAGADADYVALDAANDRAELVSNGLEWLVVSSVIA